MEERGRRWSGVFFLSRFLRRGLGQGRLRMRCLPEGGMKSLPLDYGVGVLYQFPNLLFRGRSVFALGEGALFQKE